MSIYVKNVVIDTSSDFSEELDLIQTAGSAVNLTGFSAVAHMRKTPESSSYVGFGISFIDRSNGKLVISLGSTVNSTLKGGRYVYDLMLIKSDSTKSIVVEGTVLVRVGISTGCF